MPSSNGPLKVADARQTKSAFVNDVYIMCKPARARPARSVAHSLIRGAGIDGKTRVWNASGTVPVNVEARRRLRGGWRTNVSCGRPSHPSLTCNVRGRSSSNARIQGGTTRSAHCHPCWLRSTRGLTTKGFGTQRPGPC